MSIRVKVRARQLAMNDVADRADNHELRVIIDEIIAKQTGLPCDTGVDYLTDGQFREIVEKAKERLKKKRQEGTAAYLAAEAHYSEVPAGVA